MSVDKIDATFRSRRGTGFVGVSTMEVADKAWAIEIVRGFPGVVIGSITFPTNKIVQLTAL